MYLYFVLTLRAGAIAKIEVINIDNKVNSNRDNDYRLQPARAIKLMLYGATNVYVLLWGGGPRIFN